MRSLSTALVVTVVFAFATTGISQNTATDDAMQSCPMHAQHSQNAHHAMVEKNGDQAMGFAHEKTTHHFRLSSDGGAIEVTANDSNDKTSAEEIRSHLSHIAAMFSHGDFSTPMFVHAVVPPGVTTMKMLRAKLEYRYEEIASGGRVRIAFNDPIAVAAVHDFLRFQITDHQTGDNLEVQDPR